MLESVEKMRRGGVSGGLIGFFALAVIASMLFECVERSRELTLILSIKRVVQ